jgi:hypothetical protein
MVYLHEEQEFKYNIIINKSKNVMYRNAIECNNINLNININTVKEAAQLTSFPSPSCRKRTR